jgi:hypothetical protein
MDRMARAREDVAAFSPGVGGKIGSDKQWMSWIALDDVVGALRFALTNEVKWPIEFRRAKSSHQRRIYKTRQGVVAAYSSSHRFQRAFNFWRMGEALLSSAGGAGTFESNRIRISVLATSGALRHLLEDSQK